MDENTELATAYIPIVPSMDGFSAKLSKLMNSEADKAGEKAGTALGSGLLGTLGKVVSAAAIGKLLKTSFLEGAALEQSIGGVETLFKDSADEIKAYAAEAYNTAGLSANEYMETATSFSASLIKSLGGDTQAAAKATQIAITDMSDNVNKFGGDVQNLQNAYQGFARDNFTMLDNLRLGYAGNKEGMQQLLADAEALSGIHYDISSYADMIEAIHVIQENLDITGTTAKEASNTFSGSFNAMKASAKNLAGMLTTGGDVESAVKALETTTLTFGKNALRMFDNLMDGLGGVGDAIEVVTAATVGYFTVTKGAELIGKINKGLEESGGLMGKLSTINPYAAAIAGAAALATAGKAYIDHLTDELNEIPDPYSGLTASQKELVDSTAELTQEIGESSKKRKEALDGIESERKNTQILINEMYKLNSAETLNAASKATLSALVDDLNEKYPDLGLELDKATGHVLNMQDALGGLAEVEQAVRNARKEEAENNLSDVVLQRSKALDKQAEAEKKLREAQSERDKIQRQLNAAQETHDKLLSKSTISSEDIKRQAELEEIIPELQKQLEEYNDAVGAMSSAYVSASSSVRELNKEFEVYNATLTAAEAEEQKIADKSAIVTDAMDALRDFTATTSKETYQLSQDTLEKISEISNAYGETVRAQEDNIRRSLDLFSEFSGGTKIEAAEMLSNLESNRQGLEDWANNIKDLAGRGIEEGLLRTLTEAGPSSASKVQALVSMSKTELDKYSSTWAETQKLIVKTAEDQNKKLLDNSLTALSDLIEQTGGKRPSMEEAMELLAGAGTDSYFDTFRGNVAKLAPTTGEEIISYIAQGVRSGKYNYELDAALANALEGSMQYARERLLEQEFGEMVRSTMDGRSASEALNASSDDVLRGMRGYNTSPPVSSLIPTGEGAEPAARPLNVRIESPDGRQLASWMIDDINDLQAADLSMSRRGLF